MKSRSRSATLKSKQKLGPPGQYHVYRFDVNVDAPKGARPLGIMPTDSVSDAWSPFIPSNCSAASEFPATCGPRIHRQTGRVPQCCLRSLPFDSCLSTSAVPTNAHVHFGMGVTAKDQSVKFRVR